MRQQRMQVPKGGCLPLPRSPNPVTPTSYFYYHVCASQEEARIDELRQSEALRLMFSAEIERLEQQV